MVTPSVWVATVEESVARPMSEYRLRSGEGVTSRSELSSSRAVAASGPPMAANSALGSAAVDRVRRSHWDGPGAGTRASAASQPGRERRPSTRSAAARGVGPWPSRVSQAASATSSPAR